MNIQEILGEIKKLSDDDIVKFNKEFSAFYKPFKKKEDEIKKEQKKKEDELKLVRVKEIGDKICELYEINGFPVSSVHKCYDAPYSTYEDYGGYVLDDCNIEPYIKKVDEETDKELDKLFKDFYNNMSDKEYLNEKKEADDLYPGDTIFNFYMKGGTFKKVMDNEVESIITA